MKKYFYGLVTAWLSLTFVPLQAQQKDKPKTEQTEEQKKEESELLLNRLKEIQQMDKAELSSDEKKELKREVRTIEKRLHDLNGGLIITAIGIGVIVALLLIMF